MNMQKKFFPFLFLMLLFTITIGAGQVFPQKAEAARTISQTKKKIKKINKEIKDLNSKLASAKKAKRKENKENKQKTKGCKDVLFASVLSTSPFIIYADYVIGETGCFLVKGGSANWGSTYSGSIKLTGKTGVWNGYTYQEAVAVSIKYKAAEKVRTLKKRIQNKKNQLKKLKGDIILQPSLKKDTVYLYVKDSKDLGWSVNTYDHTFSKAKSVIWKSSDPSIVTVKNGRIDALKSGTVTVTVTGRISGKKDSVTIVAAPRPYLQTSVDSLEMEVGETAEVVVDLIYPEELGCSAKDIVASIGTSRHIGFEVDYSDQLSNRVGGRLSLTLIIKAHHTGEDEITITVADYNGSMDIKDIVLPVTVYGTDPIEDSETNESDNNISDDVYYDDDNDYYNDYYDDDYLYDDDDY